MSKTRDILARFKRVIDRNINNPRYSHLTREDMEQSLVDSLNYSLPMLLGNEYQSFYAYYDNDGELKIEVTRTWSTNEDIRYYFFELGLLSEHNIVLILKEFQSYLDYAESNILFHKIKTLKNSLIYGSVIRYVNDEATVEFMTDDGEVMYGFCSKRHLLEEERSFEALRKEDIKLFYIRDIQLLKNSRLDIRLNTRSKRIPELLLKKYIQYYGYNIDDYRYKCIYRVPGKFCRIVTLNYIDKDIINSIQDELHSEVIQVLCIKDESLIRDFNINKLSYEQLASIILKNKKKKKPFNL